jgi:hypothetical protein
MQSSTGQYSTQAGDPAQPVQHSVMTASSFGFFLRAVVMPFERGSCFISSGTIPGALADAVSGAMTCDFNLPVELLPMGLPELNSYCGRFAGLPLHRGSGVCATITLRLKSSTIPGRSLTSVGFFASVI